MAIFEIEVIPNGSGFGIAWHWRWKFLSGPKGSADSNGEVMLALIEEDKRHNRVPLDDQGRIQFAKHDEALTYVDEIITRSKPRILSQHSLRVIDLCVKVDGVV